MSSMPDYPRRLPTTAAIEPPRLVGVDEFAAILQVSPRTLWRLLSARKLPEPIRVGRSVRWKLSDIREWIDSGCPPTDRDQE